MASVIEDKATKLIQDELSNWEDGTAFITEKVAFQIRNLIRQLRKNYWGVFDNPQDPTTGRNKVWIPLTESLVEAVVKNIDLDTKDINFRAKKHDSIGVTHLVRSIVKNELDKIGFGEKLDMLSRDLAIDGTAIWFTGEKEDINGEKVIDIRRVDPLNFYIDPTAPSIQEAESVIERVIIPIDEFRKLAKANNWVNTNLQEGTEDITRTDRDFNFSTTMGSKVKMVELFKRVGKTPNVIFSGEDKDTEITNAEVVVSSNGSNYIFHGAEKRDKAIKPYEEAWYSRVPGRWYGKGVAEKLMNLQIWLNTVVNIRINRHYISQLGIFKIKKNRGITPQMISRLAANGAILVDDQDDIEQFPMQEASESSYADEKVIQSWAERNTSAFEVVTGEGLPASTTATATAIQGRNAQSQFTLVKEGTGLFLQRWIKNHVMPIIVKNLTKGDIIRITGEVDDIRKYDEAIVNKVIADQINELTGQGALLDPAEIEAERQRLLAKANADGEDRFQRFSKSFNPTDFDAQVFITNEEFDKGVMIQNLISMLQISPELKDFVVPQAMDLMGLGPVNMKTIPQSIPAPQASVNPPMQSEQELLTRANTGAATQSL